MLLLNLLVFVLLTVNSPANQALAFLPFFNVSALLGGLVNNHPVFNIQGLVDRHLTQEAEQEHEFLSLDLELAHSDTAENHLSIFTSTFIESIQWGRRHRKFLLEVLARVQRERLTSSLPPDILVKKFAHLKDCHGVSIHCQTKSKYRTEDGSCNNLKNRNWGKASLPMRRWLDPAYDDAVASPRTASVISGASLPSARTVSTTVHLESQNGDAHKHFTHVLMQWGQFLDHDITSTAKQQLLAGPYGMRIGPVACCSRNGHILDKRPQCFPIVIPSGDRHFKKSCMNFARSVQVENAECVSAPAEQLNQISAYIDASQVYGSSNKEQRSLRTLNDGMLNDLDNHLPEDTSRHPGCSTFTGSNYCFKAGDKRVNENPTLQSMHTVFLREHNRIAKELKHLNNHWDDEKIFQESRKIVGAIIQKISYGEYLPIILGPTEMDKYGLDIGSGSGYRHVYNSSQDASIRNAFAAAAFRMGHSMIQDRLGSFDTDHVDRGHDNLSKTFGDTSFILSNTQRSVGRYCRGLVNDHVQSPDHKITKQVTDLLFLDANGNSFDLAALNIQRGRDHGLPPYIKWRNFCGLMKDAEDFQDLADTHTDSNIKLLEKAYSHVGDIDLFPGALTETPVGGGLVGPTLTCLLGRQFKALKTGDRFWFEENNSYVKFTTGQVKELRKASLSRVLCDNTDTKTMQTNAFKKNNHRIDCCRLPHIDLSQWKDGHWLNWSNWGPCKGGRQTRIRSCEPGSCDCKGSKVSTRRCKRPYLYG